MKPNYLKSLGAAVMLAALPAAALPALAQAPPPFPARAGVGHVTWSGTVDDTTTISVRGRDVTTRVVSGKSTSDVSSQVIGRLPDRPVRVFLRQRSGRGQMRVVQQPNFGNNFTARVRIHDPQSGSSFYRFVLSWQGRGPRPFGAGRGRF